MLITITEIANHDCISIAPCKINHLLKKPAVGGMPIIDADKARVVVIIKRSLSVGYAGVDNDLFYDDKTMMLFGDGKKMMNELNSSI